MDPSFSHAQAMGQSPFFYYNPDPKSDNRQHGHFSQQPSNMAGPVYSQQAQMQQMHQMQHLQQMQQMPPTPIYSRPNSSGSQPPMMFNPAYAASMTPMVSPRPMYHKPTILIQDHSPRLMGDSDFHEGDMYYYPSTPPLSAPGSAISSPSGSDMVPTPLSTVFYGLEGFEGVKEGCEGEVQSENLAGGEWARCGSPPMTPGM